MKVWRCGEETRGRTFLPPSSGAEQKVWSKALFCFDGERLPCMGTSRRCNSLHLSRVYYDGLNIAYPRQTLEHPSQVYDRFPQNSSLPDSLKEWNAINVDDEAQLKVIWQN